VRRDDGEREGDDDDRQLTLIHQVDNMSQSDSQSLPITSTPVKQVIKCEPVSPGHVTSAAELQNLARIYSTLIKGMSCYQLTL